MIAGVERSLSDLARLGEVSGGEHAFSEPSIRLATALFSVPFAPRGLGWSPPH